MLNWIKKHKKLFGSFLVAVLGALVTLITALVNGCTSSGMWKADFQKYPERDVVPIYCAEELPIENVIYPFALPKKDISEVGGFENND